MNNSSWQMNRIGLVDFWYYDEEEFWFRDGRMLLRGSNGSGKSVTMQSFIPLILDGNMRPERLDPFGSRARRMENYLLEEGDGREERTGYLYLELKRRETESYLTIGIGMRARRNKKLETWYFYIGDGRRMGREIFLYKDVDSRIPLSRQELKNRIGEGGRVMESQTEYMETVNRMVFGFETIDQYKEMLDLLIQLRSPKLSKDFKPTVLNEILSSSLLMLSEEDLRPMSEAIENMDALKVSLDALRESMQAARQVERGYDAYNAAVLCQKAQRWEEVSRQLKKSTQEVEEANARQSWLEQEVEKQKEHYLALQQEEQGLKEQKDSLDASDAVRLKEQEVELQRQLAEADEDEARKDSQRREKEDRLLEVTALIRHQTDSKEQKWEELETLLEEMQQETEELAFDEAAFLQRDFRERPEEEYDFRAHHRLLEDYQKKVTEGVRVLREEQQSREHYDRELRELDECRMQRDRAERESQELSRQLQEIREELLESCYRWERENQELKLPETVLQALSRAIRSFEEQSDYHEILDLIRIGAQKREETLRSQLQEERWQQRQLLSACSEKQEELTALQNSSELAPPRTAAVEKNRERLRKKGIPFYPFYQAVDFAGTLPQEAASRLEEALLQMGLLDALIVPAEYREEVLSYEEGSCDRYLFGDGEKLRSSLMEVLEIDNPSQDIFLQQLIVDALRRIGYESGTADSASQMDGTVEQEPGFPAWIREDGRYQLGVLEGTCSGSYEAQYMGAGTRERSRQRRLLQLTLEYEELQRQREACEQRLQELESRLTVWRQELERFPAGTDIRLAAREYGAALTRLERAGGLTEAARKRVEAAAAELSALQLQVQTVCAAAYLTPRLDVFEEAEDSLRAYQRDLAELQALHSGYCSCCMQLRSRSEQEEELQALLEDIRYDLSGLARKQRGLSDRLQAVQEQMKLTDYEEIRAVLEHCVKRLQEIPAERERAVGSRSSLESELQQVSQELQKSEEKKQRLSAAVSLLGEDFDAEYALGYHSCGGEELQREQQVSLVLKQLTGSWGSRTVSECSVELQTVYLARRGELLAYQTTLDTIFQESEEQKQRRREAGVESTWDPKRIDLKGKYRGRSVTFRELLELLAGEIEEKSRLLSDKDRELFEDILANTISKKIRARIHESNAWVDRMNQLMEQMRTSSGLKLSLRWKSKRAEQEEQLDTRELVALLQKDAEIMRPEEVEQLSRHFRSKIEEARRQSENADAVQSFHAIMREVLDYRKWFEFQLEYQKTGEMKKELTDRAFFTFSGGEKAMSMYVPLFSAAVAKYKGANADAPRIISLDEAFAGVDEMNIKDMFRLMVDFEFDFIINSQILYGDYETVPSLAIYQLIRPENAKYVSVIAYEWNGAERRLVD